MPQALETPPSENAALRQCSTAPNLRIGINRYADLDSNSPTITDSPPSKATIPMKFFPFPSKYGQLSGMSVGVGTLQKSNIDLSSSGVEKPKFTIGSFEDTFHEDFSGFRSRPNFTITPPTMVNQSCDTPIQTPRGTPCVSPQTNRKKSIDSPNSRSTGFLGWLINPSSYPKAEESIRFFHQKEDLVSDTVSITEKARKLKQTGSKSKLVSMSDINIFTPTEY